MEVGLLDVTMLHHHVDIGSDEALSTIEVGCEMRLPSPLDVSVAKKVQIQILRNEEPGEIYYSGSGDSEDEEGSGSGLFSGDFEDIESNGTVF